MDQDTDIKTRQSVRYGSTIVQFETFILDGIEYLFFEDVQQRFPAVTSLCIDDTQLAFIRDENGNRLVPWRIKAYKDTVIDARDPEESMLVMQKTVDLIRVDTQETLIRLKQAMVLMYELHEYTTPRYFYILPVEEYKKGAINAVKNLFLLHYKLYFFCECSNEPNQLHVAPHGGYLIKKPKEFIATYGAHIRTTLDVVRAVLTVSSVILPELDDLPEFVNNEHIPSLNTSDITNVRNKLDAVEELLNQAGNATISTDLSVIPKTTSERVPLQGAHLRELGAYLENVDKSKSLGNLHRMITDDGHVRWVCLEHFDSVYFNKKTSEHIHQFGTFGGTFNQDTKEAVINDTNFTNENIRMFCDLLTKGFNIVNLVFKTCSLSESDLDKLLDIILNRSFIRYLEIINVTIQNWRGKLKYTCNNMSVRIKNQSVEIEVPSRHQTEDIKMSVRLWLQNKIHRIFNFCGCGSFPEYEESLLRSLQTKTESKALIVNYLNNIDFLNNIFDRDSPPTQLKLNFCFGLPSALTQFCQTLAKNQTLVELDIMNYTGFDNENFIIQIMKSLRSHKSLKQLSLLVSNLKPSDEKEVHLIDLLLKDSFVSRLRLLDSTISKNLTQALVQASQKHHSLTYLELHNYQMTDEDVSSLQALRTDGSLTHLILSNEQYCCIVLKEMQQQFQKGKRL